MENKKNKHGIKELKYRINDLPAANQRRLVNRINDLSIQKYINQ